MRVVEHAAAVVVEECLRQRAFGDDHVVAVELDVEIFDLVDAFRLHDRDAVDEVLGLDQHAAAISKYMAWCGETHRSRLGTFASSAPALMQIGRMSCGPG